MRVISKSRLQQFWIKPGCESSEGPLRAWYSHVSNRTIDWNCWSDVKADFATVSHVGNCVVFNIVGNKFRLIVRVLYPSHKVFILKVMTHSEYDDATWKKECDCFDPPPKRSRTASKRSMVKKTRRKR